MWDQLTSELLGFWSLSIVRYCKKIYIEHNTIEWMHLALSKAVVLNLCENAAR
jgi:hypothetical protein